ncbi:MAG: STAS domain-containing protein [Trueperaceae bacterium]
MRTLEHSVRPQGAATVVAVSGTVDAVTAPRFAEALQAEVAGGASKLVVDLADVAYISSAGLRAVLAALKAARAAGGDLRLAGAVPAVAQVFDLAGFGSILESFDDVDGAVASFD